MTTYSRTSHGVRAAALAAAAIATGTSTAFADQVIADDLIVNGGSACIGFDCVDGESFGFDSLRLKENNLRIHFDDTSTAASFPSNDWAIEINDTNNGGENYFSIVDRTAGQTLFRLCAVADATCTNIVPATAATPQTATNTANIATNTANIATNTADIATNTANIATNTTNITTNAANIATNTADIATNAQGIATNAQDIQSLDQRVASNASAIQTTNALLDQTNERVDALEERTEINRDGIAMAFAMGSPLSLGADQTFAIGANLGFFDGAEALGVNSVLRLSDNASLSGGFGYGFESEQFGGKIGMQIGW